MTTVPLETRQTVAQPETPAGLDWRALAPALCVFFLISYLLVVALHLLFPGTTQFSALVTFVRETKWQMTWLTFISGLIECVILGCYAALVFCPIYSAFAHAVHAWQKRHPSFGA